jgi:hypothetical protein
LTPEEEEEKKNRPPDFSLYTDLRETYRRSGDDIFYQFLNKVYDTPQEELLANLPSYLRDLSKYS